MSKPALPLSSYANTDIFKTYLHDIGLLGEMSHLRPEVILAGEQLFQEYKGATRFLSYRVYDKHCNYSSIDKASKATNPIL